MPGLFMWGIFGTGSVWPAGSVCQKWQGFAGGWYAGIGHGADGPIGENLNLFRVCYPAEKHDTIQICCKIVKIQQTT